MKTFKNSALLLIGLLFFSCTEDKAILLDDNKYSKPIPQVPVNTDYTVGAIYKMEEITRNLETPSIGIYNGSIADSTRYIEHVKQAKTAGVDFFIFNLRSSNANDMALIDGFQTATEANPMDFAFSYNFANMGLTPASTIENKGFVTRFIDDFKLMKPYFDLLNYKKINGGKAVVYINNSFNLFSNDNTALYELLRKEMRVQGVELYLIGMQLQWSPTLKYFGDKLTGKDNRFQGCVDALTYTNYANIEYLLYDRLVSFHNFVDIAWSYHKETLAKYNIEFVPTISPSYNSAEPNPGVKPNYDIPKNADWFKANCNIARRSSGASKLVIIDSFNDWNFDTQIESATSYGDEYLKIVKSEFKVN
jgi:hypothetical protein